MVGVLLLLCTSLLWLGDVSMMSSALLSVKGLLHVAGLLGVPGLLSFVESGRIFRLLRVAGLLSIVELQRIAGVGMSDCFLQGIQPCKCKEEGHE